MGAEELKMREDYVGVPTLGNVIKSSEPNVIVEICVKLNEAFSTEIGEDRKVLEKPILLGLPAL